jgi:hypothetical protein
MTHQNQTKIPRHPAGGAKVAPKRGTQMGQQMGQPFGPHGLGLRWGEYCGQKAAALGMEAGPEAAKQLPTQWGKTGPRRGMQGGWGRGYK